MKEDLVLRYSHNIVEHLGLKLYQNQPTRVIAELVSNSWDADAEKNLINMNMDTGERWVSVFDNGHGMTREELLSSYLIIGHPKRVRPEEKSRGGRKLMGRKGIGKLASFGIARFVDIITIANHDESTLAYWLRFDRDALLGHGDEDQKYRPEVICDGVKIENIPILEDQTGQIKEFIELIIKTTGTGTAILMSELSISKGISKGQLLASL